MHRPPHLKNWNWNLQLYSGPTVNLKMNKWWATAWQSKKLSTSPSVERCIKRRFSSQCLKKPNAKVSTVDEKDLIIQLLNQQLQLKRCSDYCMDEDTFLSILWGEWSSNKGERSRRRQKNRRFKIEKIKSLKSVPFILLGRHLLSKFLFLQEKTIR